jgi:hypothetical protein
VVEGVVAADTLHGPAVNITYWLTLSGAAGGNPVNILAAGRGVDELVKVDGRWLIRSRNVTPED